MKFYFLKFIITPAVLLSSLLLPVLVSAQITIPNPLKAATFPELLDYIIDFIFILALGIAPIMIIVAGFYFITAAGDPAKIQTAKQIILYTLIGLLIVFSAKGLIELFAKVFQTTPPSPI